MTNKDTRTLYNGIVLPETWPPRTIDFKSRDPIPVSYLCNIPDPIPINLGRQLFVDDFLVDNTDMHRVFHRPHPHEGNPVFEPRTALEMNAGVCPTACPFNDGVFYDDREGLFKMWYHAGWFDGTALAYSKDGIDWERPEFDIQPGTNRVIPSRDGFQRDGAGIWLDHGAETSEERYKMFLYHRKRFRGTQPFSTPTKDLEWEGGHIYTSGDGIHWKQRVETSACGDNTTIFYNPFRNVWVYSVRVSTDFTGRARAYREHENLVSGAHWEQDELVNWSRVDELDASDPDLGYTTQLYNIDAVAYESVLIGLHQIHYGPPNELCEETGIPKTTDLMIGYSRDGFHWHRPDRQAFVKSSRTAGQWNRGYLHSSGGCFLVVNDKLYFYVTGFSGASPAHGHHMYAGGSTGLYTLRRDGFASMDAREETRTLTTRTVSFEGEYLFVNASSLQGRLQVEVLHPDLSIVEGYSAAECIAFRGDSTKAQIRWRERDTLRGLANRPVKFRFVMDDGALYSFWVSDDPLGASGGYLAAGGPDCQGVVDRG